MTEAPVFLLSVLIPTKERPEIVRACLASFRAHADAAIEILVLDQSAGDATASAISGLALAPAVVRHVRVSGSGRSRALNGGIPVARGRWLVISDDDCEPASGWLAALRRELAEAPPRAAVLGRLLACDPPPGMLAHPATIDDPSPADYAGRIARDLFYPGIAVPRAAFDEVGTFDERMSVGTDLPGGEDNDFGYRLFRAGWTIRYRPEIAWTHRAWRSPERWAAAKRAYGIGQGAFYAKHLVRGDVFIARRLAVEGLKTARACGGAALRGWWRECRGHAAYLAGVFEGLIRMAWVELRGRTKAGGEAGAA